MLNLVVLSHDAHLSHFQLKQKLLLTPRILTSIALTLNSTITFLMSFSTVVIDLVKLISSYNLLDGKNQLNIFDEFFITKQTYNLDLTPAVISSLRGIDSSFIHCL